MLVVQQDAENHLHGGADVLHQSQDEHGCFLGAGAGEHQGNRGAESAEQQQAHLIRRTCRNGASAADFLIQDDCQSDGCQEHGLVDHGQHRIHGHGTLNGGVDGECQRQSQSDERNLAEMKQQHQHRHQSENHGDDLIFRHPFMK